MELFGAMIITILYFKFLFNKLFHIWQANWAGKKYLFFDSRNVLPSGKQGKIIVSEPSQQLGLNFIYIYFNQLAAWHLLQLIGTIVA
jgi:hypothetical protein